MTTQTVPLEVRLTDPHAFKVVSAGGAPVLEVDTLTLAVKLAGRLLLNGVDIGSLAHAAVTIAGGSDPALALVGQELNLADVLTPAEHTAIADAAPHHAAVTLGGGSDPALALVGQQLTLADVLTSAEADLLYEALGDIAFHAAIAGAHHAAVTLGGGSDAALALVGQQLTLADVLTPAEHLALGAAAPHHAQLHAAADHNAAVLAAGFNENLGAFYLDIDDIAVPANPAATVRRLFVNQATGELSVRTSAGATVSLEAGGGGVAAHNLLDGVVHLDTILQGCSRGSLIYGTSGLLWDELIVGAIGTFLRADGADVYYGLILDADIPAIHSGTAHHVKYTNLEAVTAVEAEDPLDLAGVVALAKYLEFDEIAAPGAGAVNKGRLYSVDRGGLTTLEWVDSGGVTSDISHPPAVRVYNSGNQAIGNNVVSSILFDSERFDTDGMHSVAADTHKIFCVTPGKYLITANVRFASNGTGRRALFLREGNANVIINQQEWDTNQNSDTYMSLTTVYHLAAGDWILVQVYQSSGGNLNVVASGNFSPEASMVWVAP